MLFKYEEMKLIIKKRKKEEKEDKSIFYLSLGKKSLKYKNKGRKIFKLIYEVNEYINIFGEEFVEKNHKKCKMIVNNKEKKIKETIYLEKKEIKIIILEKFIDMSYMFCNCYSLNSLIDLSKWNTINVTNMSNMFSYCESVKSLDISKWNTINVTNMSFMFYNCKSLKSLDISKWNTINITSLY